MSASPARPTCIGTLKFLLILLSTWSMVACNPAVPPTPDVEELVAARLTEVAQSATAPETDGTPDASNPDATPAAAPGGVSACRVIAPAVNLRSGPQIAFAPIAVLQQGTELLPARISPDGSFMLVQVVGGGEGWISTRPDLVSCPPGALDLPVDAGPPTPTPSPTPDASPTPTPTPTQSVAVVIPRAGGGDGNLTGDVITLPDIFTGSVNRPVFHQYLMFQILVRYAPEDNGTAVLSDADGAGIQRVNVYIYDDNTGEEVYTTSLLTAPYCAFGGGNPCAVLPLRSGARWPGTNRLIEPSDYSISFEVIPSSPDAEGGSWRIEFSIAPTSFSATSSPLTPPPPTPLPATPTPQTSAPAAATPHVELARLDAPQGLVFQVIAYDPAVGDSDGAGIEYVVMRLTDADGTLLHERTEQGAPYCLFSNAPGAANCNVWSFAANNFRWPNNTPVQSGNYRLTAEVFATSGSTRTLNIGIQLQGN